MNTVKLVSGGIDSYIMSQEFEGTNVYIDFGQKYAEMEKRALKSLCVPFDEISVNSKFKDGEIYIPDRNLTFASLVAMIYNPDRIMLAGLADDNCEDKNPEAFRIMSNTISQFAGKRIEVESPYFGLTKGELVYRFLDKDKLIKAMNLRKTFSCYKPNADGRPCGNCPACLRKAIALETNGVRCEYSVNFDIVREYLKKIHTYQPDRISRFFIWLKQYYDVNAVDIDGVICQETGRYEDRKPLKRNIEAVNNLPGIIVLYSARLEIDRDVTETWLRQHEVRYDALILGKMPYSVLYDDHAINTKETI